MAVPRQVAGGLKFPPNPSFRVPNVNELQRQRQRAEELGATLLYDRTADDNEPLYVLADPAGHPFCLLVGAG
jgi:hypothetical protein